MRQECSACFWWKKDYGIWCFNGWSGMDRNNGHCHLEPKPVSKEGNDYCSHWKSAKDDPKPRDPAQGGE